VRRIEDHQAMYGKEMEKRIVKRWPEEALPLTFSSKGITFAGEKKLCVRRIEGHHVVGWK
jgi:hypothetical protein